MNFVKTMTVDGSAITTAIAPKIASREIDIPDEEKDLTTNFGFVSMAT